MKELSLHILDMVQNSIYAGASSISIEINEDISRDTLTIAVEDDGNGIDRQAIEKVKDPFYTSRTTRKVGLGIPLLMAAAKRCEGDLTIDSTVGKGTRITAFFKYSHIDRAPLGNIWDTISGIIACNEKVDFVYTHIYDGRKLKLDTKEVRGILGEVPISAPDVIQWISNYISEGIKSISGGGENEVNSGIGGNKEKDPPNIEC
jgi:hypothetical protein